MQEKNFSCPAKNFSEISDIEKKILEILESGETKICIILLSGGIDSSTAAFLLQENGFKVIGVHYDFGDTYKTNLPNKCCNNEDLSDAERIAKQFNFPFFNLNYREKFRGEIIDKFIEKKSKGEEFNPCILCHKKIKYGEIFDLVKKYGIKIASGYYCKIENGELFFSKDKNKDQTFSMIMDFKKEDLKYLEFPLGKYLKSEVRCIAKNHKIEKFNKKESMGLCFVGEKRVKDFIKNYCENKEGKIYFWDGKNFEFLGKNKLHKGLGLYEVGENSGHCLSSRAKRSIAKDPGSNNLIKNFSLNSSTLDSSFHSEGQNKRKSKPLFVYKKISEKNILILAEKEKIFHKKFFSKNFNILGNLEIGEEKKLKIKYNSNEEEVDGKIVLLSSGGKGNDEGSTVEPNTNENSNLDSSSRISKGQLIITLNKEIQSIIPGQIFVLIDEKNGGKIFGGGEIGEFFYEENFLEKLGKLK